MVINLRKKVKSREKIIHITKVYASSKWNQRIIMWNTLRKTANARHESCPCIRISIKLWQTMKNKEDGRRTQESWKQLTLMMDTSLVDLGFNGQRFTSNNNTTIGNGA